MMEAAANLYDSILFVIFINHFSKCRYAGKRRRCFSLLGMALLFSNSMLASVFDGYVFVVVVDAVIVLAYSLLALERQWMKNAGAFIFYQILLFFSSSFSIYLFMMTGRSADDLMNAEATELRNLYLLFTKLFLLLLVLFILYLQKSLMFAKSKLVIAAYIVVPITMIYICLQLMMFISEQKIPDGGSDKLIRLVVLLLALFFVIVYISVYAINSEKKQKENETLRMMLGQERKRQEMILQYEKENWRLRHDLGNKMLIVRSMMEENRAETAYQKISEIVEEFCGQISPEEKMQNTFSSMIEYKRQTAQKKGVQMSVNIRQGWYEGIDPTDIGVLMGNLLDNAISASEKIEGAVIHIYMHTEFGMIYLSMENPCEEKKKERTHDDFKHGFGLKSIREIVEKYQGEFETVQEKGQYQTKILLQQNV